jgi:hypothetical protein
VAAASAGWSLRAIATVLNDCGVPPGHGGAKWYASTVRAVLGEPSDRERVEAR